MIDDDKVTPLNGHEDPALSGLYRSAQKPEPPAHLDARIHAAARVAQPRRRHTAYWLPGIAAGVIIGIAVVQLYPKSMQETAPSMIRKSADPLLEQSDSDTESLSKRRDQAVMSGAPATVQPEARVKLEGSSPEPVRELSNERAVVGSAQTLSSLPADTPAEMDFSSKVVLDESETAVRSLRVEVTSGDNTYRATVWGAGMSILSEGGLKVVLDNLPRPTGSGHGEVCGRDRCHDVKGMALRFERLELRADGGVYGYLSLTDESSPLEFPFGGRIEVKRLSQ